MQLFAKKINNFQSFTSFVKSSTLNVWYGSDYDFVQETVKTSKPSFAKTTRGNFETHAE